MKRKIITIGVFILCGCGTNTEQNNTDKPIINSKIDSSGQLIYKRRDPIGTINKCLVSEIITYDFKEKDTIRTIQFEFDNIGNTYRNEMNKNELELMLQGYNSVLDNQMKKSTPESGMIQYKSNQGITAGAYQSNTNEWRFFIQIDTVDENSTIFMNENECLAFVLFLKNIKQKL